MKVEVIGPPGQTVEGEGGGVEGEGEKGGGVGHTPPSKEFGSMELEWKASHSQLELGEDGKGFPSGHFSVIEASIETVRCIHNIYHCT